MTEAQTPAVPAEAAAERAPRQSRSGGDTVTVACKLPNGLRCRVFKMGEDYEPVMGGGSRKVPRAQLAGEFVLGGTAVKMGEAPRSLMAGGYALTPGVDKDLWDRWQADNIDSPMVTNGLVFAHEKQGHTADRAKEQAAVRSNMEPLKGAEDIRVPKSRGLKIKTADRAA